MGRYRAADILLPPGLISLARLPLAAAFPCVIARPAWAVAVLAAAGASDILDGWLARRFGWATPTGAVVDGITDKLFVASVAVTLVSFGYLGVYGVLLLSIREIAELPLVLWWLLHREQRQRRSEDPRANATGKAATMMQFGTVVLALADSPWLDASLWTTAAGGAVAAILYWKRELSTLEVETAEERTGPKGTNRQ